MRLIPTVNVMTRQPPPLGRLAVAALMGAALFAITPVASEAAEDGRRSNVPRIGQYEGDQNTLRSCDLNFQSRGGQAPHYMDNWTGPSSGGRLACTKWTHSSRSAKGEQRICLRCE